MQTKRRRKKDIVVVYKKSKLDLYVHENHNARYRKLVQKNDSAVDRFQAAHDAHHRTLDHVVDTLERLGHPHRVVYRANFRNEGAYVITVGGDGTLLDASRRVVHATVLGVNSDTRHSGGFLCAGNRQTFRKMLDGLLENSLHSTEVTRLGGTLDGVPLKRLVLNDILVAQSNPADTVRYELRVGRKTARQKSSGIWISTAVGSTAGIRSAGGKIQDFEEPELQYWVRELYLTGTKAALRHGFVGGRKSITVKSQMREGRIFLDGPHTRIPFQVGSVLKLHGNAPKLRLVVTPKMRRHRRKRNVASRPK